jgi:glutaredoxin
MKSNALLAVLMFAMMGPAQAGNLYRSVDKSGKVQYSDAPPEGALQTEQKKFGVPTPDNETTLSYASRQAKGKFPVTLYVSESCGEGCQKARDLLNKRGIPFTEKNLVGDDEIQTFKQLTRSEVTPTLLVGKTALKGFLAEQWDSELSNAGYAKSAPYGYRTSPAQSPVQPTEQTGR